MPEKRDSYRSYGEKLISLFARLLFSGQSHSLPDLARMLNCSKQTVLRLVDDIRRAYSVDVEEEFQGKRKFFRIKKQGRGPALPLTEMEMNILSMCQTFARHLLGERLFEDATGALLKSQALLPQARGFPPQHFGSFLPGTIDYTPHRDTFKTLIQAMDEKRICKVSYRALWHGKTKTYYIKPLKLFSYRETVYLHARMARAPGKKHWTSDFDPLLAVHRIKKVEMTERHFEFPADYDFESAFNREFGVIKEEPFEVEVDFSGWAARYVCERVWSPDQKIKKRGDGKTVLTFTASSEPELTTWILSLGAEARLVKPGWLLAQVTEMVERLHSMYAPPQRLLTR